MSGVRCDPNGFPPWTRLAETCDFDLSRFPAVRAWLDRVADEPGHVAMEWQPDELAAAE